MNITKIDPRWEGVVSTFLDNSIHSKREPTANRPAPTKSPRISEIRINLLMPLDVNILLGSKFKMNNGRILLIRKNGCWTRKRVSTHYCYLLKSINPKYLRHTYIGYTTNPSRRLRQHNGEITGGAKTTSGKGPWILICYIEGFIDKRSALQYEWINHHPKCRRKGVEGRIWTLAETLSMDKWNSIPKFIIHWMNYDYKMPYLPPNCIEIYD